MTAVPLSDQIAAVRREIGMRKNVYPRWILNGKMPAAKAASEMSAMEAVLATLEELDAKERLL